jgi:GxxExxY protein
VSNEQYRGEYSGGHEGRGGGHRGGGRGRGRDGGYHERRGIPLSELDPTLTDFSRRVIGAAIEVHKTLGPGYDEAVYLTALKGEMQAVGLNFKAMHAFNVNFKDRKVGEAITDLFVEDRFIVEVMARPGDVSTYDRLSARAKLKAGNLDLGLVINFAERRLKDGLVRVLNIDKINAEKGITGEHDDEGHDEGGGGGGGNFADFDEPR